MRRALGFALAALPLAAAWAGPIATAAGYGESVERLAGPPSVRFVGWTALILGGAAALMNFFLSFVRPRLVSGEARRRHVSGVPLVGTLLLVLAAVALAPAVWASALVTALMAADTGGPHWFVIMTWRDRSLWGEASARERGTATGRGHG